jgi:hypothetical protein
MSTQTSGPAKMFRSLHLRIRDNVATELHTVAQYDTIRTDRRHYVAEIHRAALRRYLDDRKKKDPELARALEAAITRHV